MPPHKLANQTSDDGVYPVFENVSESYFLAETKIKTDMTKKLDG